MQIGATYSDPLRRELSRRNLDRASKYGYEHEATYGEVPSILYRASNGAHGNFLLASYRSICADPQWHKRLDKSYSASRRVARSWERNRFELDCANSSDALLMNIFCYPKVLWRRDLCTLLGIEVGLRPAFGIKPRIPFLNGRTDRTEMDMCLGDVLVEAKLTETGFQTASSKLITRYRDLHEVFELEDLPMEGNEVESYQLIRGVLGAHAGKTSFLVLCDSRRSDLIEHWFHVMQAVRSYSLRNRLKLLTWQELATALPPALKLFLGEKYGIFPSPASSFP
jgi:hypothetical protein